MDDVGKNLNMDMSNTTVVRVNSVEGIEAALNSGNYTDVIYYGHTVGGDLTPTFGQNGMSASVFNEVLPSSARNVYVFGCQSSDFTNALYTENPSLTTAGMNGNLYDHVNLGVLTDFYTGGKYNPVPVSLAYNGKTY